MIPDKDSNFVYLSDLLPHRCPGVYRELTRWLKQLHLGYGLLTGTRDIWAVDYMPLQVRQDYFVQYCYDPDYLKAKKWQATRTNPADVCAWAGVEPHRQAIVLDGGNAVKSSDRVIVTTKVFSENRTWAEHRLIEELQRQLSVAQVVVIPQEPGDYTGHADGMVRFVDEDTVLVNQYPSGSAYGAFGLALRWSLRNAGLQVVQLPYTAWQNRRAVDATGCYINFLEVDRYLFYPIYGQRADKEAGAQLQRVFSDRELIAIDCRELAVLGGVLNCISWNIRR